MAANDKKQPASTAADAKAEAAADETVAADATVDLRPAGAIAQDQAIDEEQKVLVYSPKEFTFHRDNGKAVHVRIGNQLLPASDLSHWYVKVHGVKAAQQAAQ